MTIVESVGWVLVHFIWQGAAIVGALWLVLTLATPTRATLRYALGCGALALMLLAPLLTAVFLVRTAHLHELAEGQMAAAPSASTTADRLSAMDARARSGAPANADDVHANGTASRERAGRPATDLSAPLWTAPQWTLARAVRPRVAAALPWLVVSWAVGVMLLSIRLAGGWWRTRGLRRHGIAPVPPSCQRVAARLVDRMRIARPVVFLVSVRVGVPIVFGHLKPVVLLPAAALSGLSPSQLEAILAHELAHVRRQDYLVNLLQTIIETLLFYHPGVWWVSRQVRQAREDCCDDMAVNVCGDRRGYVEALLGLEEIRQLDPSSAVVALGAADGSLLARARRILTGAEPDVASPRLAASAIAIAVAALAMTGVSTASDGPALVALATGHSGTSGSDVGTLALSPAPSLLLGREGTVMGSAADATDDALVAPSPAQPVMVAPDQAGPLASRRAWAEREARARRAPVYWLGYSIRPGKALPPLVYIDRHATVIGDRMMFHGNVLSQRGDGLRFAGQPLALPDADPSAIKLLLAFDTRNGPPRLTQVHGSTVPLPVAVRDLPVFWLGAAETAPSLALIDSLYGGAPDTDVRKELVAAAGVHDDSAAVVAWLDQRVRSSDPDEVRADAAEWLAWHPIPAALAALDRAARRDGASRVRQEAAEALGDLALPEATETLIALARSLDDLDARREAVEALGARPELAARDALGAIARQDADIDVQREAVETLGDYKDQRGVPLLVDLTRTHPHPDIRREAIETLGDAMPGETAVALLRQAAVEDADAGVQMEAVETLAALDDDSARAAVMDLARSHPRSEVRREAVEALAHEWHGASGGTPAPGAEAARDRAAILALLSDLADSDRDRAVQREAVETLGDLDDPQARDRLRALARSHTQPEVRQEAIETLVEHASASDARAVLREVIQKDADTGVRREAIERLADIRDAGARTELIELARTHPSEDVRAEAVESLGGAEPASEVAGLLKQIALDDRSPRVRDEAIETLAELSDGSGITALIELARAHPDPQARKQVLEALVESDHPRARAVFERALQKPSGR